MVSSSMRRGPFLYNDTVPATMKHSRERRTNSMFRSARAVLVISATLGAVPSFGSAARGAASDPFAGDTRVSAKHSLRFQNTVMRDLLADLHEQTGIAFFADNSVADDRVTVLTHDRPLADTLRAIAGFHR